MTVQEAGLRLREMYDSAPDREKVVQIHLFGIKYANEIEGLTNMDIVRHAGLYESYSTEVAKGRRLAKYVRPRE